jgi:predicted phosphoribosyltransferase
MVQFHDRLDAGRLLADRLASALEGRRDLLVLALPRGGVPVAAVLAQRLGAPLDVFMVRKLGVPGHAELAMGAIAEGGVTVLNESLVHDLGIPAHAIHDVAIRERLELDRRLQRYRDDRPAPDVAGRTVILVDDGLATGSTMEAAIAAVRARGPARVLVAVPVGAAETCDRLKQLADEVVCLATPTPFDAVGLWYVDFSETTDAEVRALLQAADQRLAG